MKIFVMVLIFIVGLGVMYLFLQWNYESSLARRGLTRGPYGIQVLENHDNRSEHGLGPDAEIDVLENHEGKVIWTIVWDSEITPDRQTVAPPEYIALLAIVFAGCILLPHIVR